MVPFEYCEMALKMKGIGWKNKLVVARRSDCPVDVVSRICRNGGERLLDDLFATMKFIPEKVIRDIYIGRIAQAVILFRIGGFLMTLRAKCSRGLSSVTSVEG